MKDYVYKINRFGVDHEFVTTIYIPEFRDGFIWFRLKDNSTYAINLEDIKDMKIYEAEE